MRPRSLVVCLAAATVLAAPGGGASARGGTGVMTFSGGGFGHGVGLSQWGAYGLARRGWGQARILRHYYVGTQVRRAQHPPARIRVGIAQGRRVIHLQAERGRVQVRLRGPRGPIIGRIPRGATWSVTRSNGRYRIVNGTGRLVGGKTWQTRPVLRYAPHHAVVRIPETGYAYSRGYIVFGVGCASCAMHLVAVVPAEQYLYGIGEVPANWPMAAMEAQAVAARTYAFEKIARLGQHQAGCDCGVVSTTQDQVYAGWTKEVEPDGGRWVAAVRRTTRQVVLYHGSLIEAFFSSSSGGHTESNAGAWGGTPLPYLRPVCDAGDFARANPSRAWSVRLSDSTVGARISRATGRRLGAAVRFVGTRRDGGGRIRQTTFVGRRGRATISGATLESALGLRSTLVWIGGNRNVLPPFRTRYDRLNCSPGFATTVQMRVRGGRVQRFPGGAMYFNGRRGRVFWLHGPVYVKYRRHGEWRGWLGLPRSDVIHRGRRSFARFERGTVRCGGGDCRLSRR